MLYYTAIICIFAFTDINMEKIIITRYLSPAGEMILGSYCGELCICNWVSGKRRAYLEHKIRRVLNAEYEEGISPILKETIAQLDGFFDGRRTDFTIPVRFIGSEFQCKVWAELVKIPFGTTISYAELARRINNPKAVRAVASANASNPVSIFVPCHRVIGSNNKLTGYAGGLMAKELLLELEARIVANR